MNLTQKRYLGMNFNWNDNFSMLKKVKYLRMLILIHSKYTNYLLSSSDWPWPSPIVRALYYFSSFEKGTLKAKGPARALQSQ